MNRDTESKQESEALSTIPPRQVDSSIFALLEQLQEMSTTPDVTVTVSTFNNNHELSITSLLQSQQHDNPHFETDHSSQFSQSEGNILSKLSLQAEQNRVQFQHLMNQTQSTQLLSTCQHEQQQRNAFSAPAALFHYAQQGAANFTDDLQQNQTRLATMVSNEQAVRNTLTLIASSSSTRVDYGGSLLSSLTSVVDRSAPTNTTINSQNRTVYTGTSDTLNDNRRDNTVLVAANLQTLSLDEQLRLRQHQAWDAIKKI